jgi:Uncharacterized conserved protein
MARYILLFSWTDQGIRNANTTVERAKAARELFRAAGAQITDSYWTLGRYDGVVIFEAPDDETAARASLAVATQGNVRSTTLRAFGEQEMERILQGLPKA